MKIIKEKDNAGKKQYTVATKVFLARRDKKLFITNSEAGNMGSGEGSPYSIVGRTELARKGFDAKRADVNESNSESLSKKVLLMELVLSILPRRVVLAEK